MRSLFPLENKGACPLMASVKNQRLGPSGMMSRPA